MDVLYEEIESPTGHPGCSEAIHRVWPRTISQGACWDMVISPVPACAARMIHLVKDEPSLWFPSLWGKRLHKGKVGWRPQKQPPPRTRQ